MLSSDWLIKGVFFNQSLVFSTFSPSEVYMSLGIPYSMVFACDTPLMGKIPSLNSLSRHGCNSELLEFLLPTNNTVKKNDRRQCQPLF